MNSTSRRKNSGARSGSLQAGAPEFGLIAPGLGFIIFSTSRMDRADQERGTVGGTPRTIEGPLYVAGAPLAKGGARGSMMGTDKGEVLVMPWPST